MTLLRIPRLAVPLCVLLALAGCEPQTETPVPLATPAIAAGAGQETDAGISAPPVGEIDEHTPLDIARSAASQEKPDPSQLTAKTKIPFQDPIQPVLYELPSGALATWRDFAAQKPTLILFSPHPLLDPIAEASRKEIRKLILAGHSQEIVQRGSLLDADPIFLPPQTVSAAIEAGLLSEIVFVSPTLKKVEDITLEAFQRLAFNAGFLTEKEALALVLHDGVIRGKVRGIPLRVVHPERLPKLATPVLVHIDLGYFKDLYANEIKTPVYDLLYQTAIAIREAAPPTLAFTYSFSNREIGIALDSRFLVSDMAQLVRNPELLAGGTPASWILRASALYAKAMFSESTARELVERATEENPDDPAAFYDLAMQQFQQRKVEEAFHSLERAVALDRGYAIEYLELAARGVEMGEREKSLELLQKAAATLPEDPFIRIQLVDLLLQSGRGEDARGWLQQLRPLPWSKEFHPEIPALLEEMSMAAESEMLLPHQPEKKQQAPAPEGFFHKGIPGH